MLSIDTFFFPSEVILQFMNFDYYKIIRYKIVKWSYTFPNEFTWYIYYILNIALM